MGTRLVPWHTAVAGRRDNTQRQKSCACPVQINKHHGRIRSIAGASAVPTWSFLPRISHRAPTKPPHGKGTDGRTAVQARSSRCQAAARGVGLRDGPGPVFKVGMDRSDVPCIGGWFHVRRWWCWMWFLLLFHVSMLRFGLVPVRVSRLGWSLRSDDWLCGHVGADCVQEIPRKVLQHLDGAAVFWRHVYEDGVSHALGPTQALKIGPIADEPSRVFRGVHLVSFFPAGLDEFIHGQCGADVLVQVSERIVDGLSCGLPPSVVWASKVGFVVRSFFHVDVFSGGVHTEVHHDGHVVGPFHALDRSLHEFFHARGGVVCVDVEHGTGHDLSSFHEHVSFFRLLYHVPYDGLGGILPHVLEGSESRHHHACAWCVFHLPLFDRSHPRPPRGSPLHSPTPDTWVESGSGLGLSPFSMGGRHTGSEGLTREGERREETHLVGESREETHM